MTMLPAAVGGSMRHGWSMTVDALDALQVQAERLARDAVRTGGYVTAFLTGEVDAPTLMPNVEGQRLLHQLEDARSALARARVETGAELAVIGRRVTLEDRDGDRTTYTIVIPGQGHPARGTVSADSPVGRAVYGRGIGDDVLVQAPNGAWTGTIRAVE